MPAVHCTKAEAGSHLRWFWAWPGDSYYVQGSSSIWLGILKIKPSFHNCYMALMESSVWGQKAAGEATPDWDCYRGKRQKASPTNTHHSPIQDRVYHRKKIKPITHTHTSHVVWPYTALRTSSNSACNMKLYKWVPFQQRIGVWCQVIFSCDYRD